MTNEAKTSAAEAFSAKRWLIGEPLASEKLEGQLLPKRLALPIFASDAVSSVAYAPQEMMMVLLLGGVSLLVFSPWITAVIVLVLVTVVLSYRQLVKAYPSGGGDFEVAHKNLGEKAGLIVASALLTDYVMTVAVSVASGVDNIISALPALHEFRVVLAVACVVLIALANLRGVREASKAFAIPTYVFIGSIGVMIVTALVRAALGHTPIAESAGYTVKSTGSLAQVAVVLLLLRAFASGCSALTGIEAIANGVQAFRVPKIRNARTTLFLLGGTSIGLLIGLVWTALVAHVHYAENPCDLVGWAQCATAPQRSLIAQLASATFGNNTVMFFIVQAATAVVLLLAANTAFNGFPLLTYVLAKEQYAPKALTTRGDRLVFSNGIVGLALAAIALLIIYQASVTALIQLYIIGVFVSFTLGQTGMVRHWVRLLRTGREGAGFRTADGELMNRASIIRSLCINSFGAVLTASVFFVVVITKFTHGAWLVFIIMPILWLLMLGVNRYYRDVELEVEVEPGDKFGSTGDHAIILVGKMQKPALKAIDYAIAAKHDSIEAVHIVVDAESTERLKQQWKDMNIHVPLTLIDSPYRDYALPLAKYIKKRREFCGSEVVTVYLPQYIVGHWWEQILHNHRARRISRELMLVHGVVIALVPWLLDSSELIYGRRSRPLPGQDRRGEPQRRMPARRPGRNTPAARAAAAASAIAAANAEVRGQEEHEHETAGTPKR